MATNKIICDTDVLLDYWNPDNPRHSDTKRVLEKSILLENVTISAITKIEILYGAGNKVELSKIIKTLDGYNTILINNEITLKAIELIQKYSLSHNLALPDCIIAASAIISELPLFTYNTRDYKFITGMELYKI